MSDGIGTTEKPIISDDDSFVFVEKAVISDDGDYGLGDMGITTQDTPQDLLAEYLSQAQQHWRLYLNGETILEFGTGADNGSDNGPDANDGMPDYLEFYNFV